MIFQWSQWNEMYTHFALLQEMSLLSLASFCQSRAALLPQIFLLSHKYTQMNEPGFMAVFTWVRITFRKTFRIAIQNVIGWWFELRVFACIVNAFPITIRICALRVYILLLLRSRRVLSDPCAYAWLQRAFLKCTRTNHIPKEFCIHMS